MDDKKVALHTKVPARTKAKAERLAAEQHRSLSNYVAVSVEEKVERDEADKDGMKIYSADELLKQERIGRETL